MEKWRVWGVPYDPPRGSRIEEMEPRYPLDIDARHASTAEQAACEWARYFDTDTVEYSIVKGEDYVVTVVDTERQERTMFRVEGRSVPQYTARPYSGA